MAQSSCREGSVLGASATHTQREKAKGPTASLATDLCLSVQGTQGILRAKACPCSTNSASLGAGLRAPAPTAQHSGPSWVQGGQPCHREATAVHVTHGNSRTADASAVMISPGSTVRLEAKAGVQFLSDGFYAIFQPGIEDSTKANMLHGFAHARNIHVPTCLWHKAEKQKTHTW